MEDVIIRPYRTSAIIEIVLHMLLHEMLHEYANRNLSNILAGSSVVISHLICPAEGSCVVTLNRTMSRKHVELLQNRQPYNTAAVRIPKNINSNMKKNSKKAVYSMSAGIPNSARSQKINDINEESAIASSSTMHAFYGFIGSTLLMPLNFMKNLVYGVESETAMEHGVFGRLASRLALAYLKSDITIVKTSTGGVTGTDALSNAQEPFVNYQYSFVIPLEAIARPNRQERSSDSHKDNDIVNLSHTVSNDSSSALGANKVVEERCDESKSGESSDTITAAIVNLDLIMRNDYIKDAVSGMAQEKALSESSMTSDRRDAPLNIVSVVSFEERSSFDYQWVFIEDAKVLPRRSSAVHSSVPGSGGRNHSYHYCNNTTDPYSTVKQNLRRLQIPFMTCHIGDIHRVLVGSRGSPSKSSNALRQTDGGYNCVGKLLEEKCRDFGRILLVKKAIATDSAVVEFFNEISGIPNISVIYVYDTERVTCRDVKYGYFFPVSLCLSRYMELTEFYVMAIKTILQLRPRVINESISKCATGKLLHLRRIIV